MMAAVKASSAPGRCLAQGKVELAANRDKVAATFGPVHGPLAEKLPGIEHHPGTVSVHSTTFCHPAKIRPKVTSQFPSEVTPMRKHRTPEQWQALVNQQRDSGLSASKFCKQENIGYASFCNWRKRLSDQAAGDSADSGEAGFLDLSSLMGAAQSGPGWNIVLSLGNGVELRLSQNG